MSRGGRLRWLWRAPARALGRARDLYVRGLTGCARYIPSDAAFGYPVFVPAAAPLSRSRSAGGSEAGDEDLQELVRAASQRRVEQRRAELRAVARSQSMAAALSMARIDEDAPCDFGGGDGGGPGSALYARSQSCAGRRARGHRKVVALV
ncbi:hypothetical protein SEVIR_9G074100v4 [Setaria viridis]|uniref:Uncharacterized protein n=2 Tax=Setaria TaxID=4554 RepID=K4AGA1_SETIT|nr:uncharacterized protein LOC101770264 [Setaria italica]XP_034572745.1 uncharacterized protein LOC117837259 [Setaria viridis]RCV40690.1 hypothetical protein SETIT_9G075500v2 [Setaria italica]TKV91114.1 hypothetical protein SEVIR_9G074100v2 [Setaria viridis]